VAEPKTRPTDADVGEFFAAVPDERRRQEALAVDRMLREATGEQPVMWGPSIVGYGAVEIENAGGKTTAWPVIGFSPRKAELVIYVSTELEPELFADLGPHRRGVACLYVKRLAAIDQGILRRVIDRSIELAQG
jgi:hypothetical protein